jgi:hypothetical protein
MAMFLADKEWIILAPGTSPHLNDVHRWSREQIADWLDAL